MSGLLYIPVTNLFSYLVTGTEFKYQLNKRISPTKILLMAWMNIRFQFEKNIFVITFLMELLELTKLLQMFLITLFISLNDIVLNSISSNNIWTIFMIIYFPLYIYKRNHHQKNYLTYLIFIFIQVIKNIFFNLILIFLHHLSSIPQTR